MARSTDPKKAALWRRRFQRFVDSRLPVVRFCTVEGVSEASFYYWRKKLGPPTRRRAARAKSRSAKAHDGKARGARAHGLSEYNRNVRCEDRAVFQPVTVLPATCGVVVRLPGGARIEVGVTHLDAIRAVVAEMVRTNHDLTTNDPPTVQNVPSHNHVIRKHGSAVSC